MSNSAQREQQTDIADLQENFSKQQAKLSALKELVRKSEEAHGKSTSSAQEKVKSIAQRLTHIKSKARSRQNLERSFSEFRDAPIIEESSQLQTTQKMSSPREHIKARSETPGTEKIQLLRQQMEQNKLKMAERENNKREIEELVTQLKARIDSTQQTLERSSELGRSMGDLTCLNPNPVSSKFRSASDLSFTPLNLDKERIKFLENRIRILEKQLEKEKSTPKNEDEYTEKIKSLENKILDLEENLKEKECIIEARTQAVSLMSESLSAKGKNTVDMLEDTRQEMFKMQSSFLETEDALKEEIQHLKESLDEKCSKIANLEEVNDILETARFELTIKNAELESKIQDGQDYSTKISELNKLNENLQHRIADLENQRNEITSSSDPNLNKQIGEEYANTIQSLQEKVLNLEKENDDLKKLAQEIQSTQETLISDNDIADRIKALESTIDAQNEEIKSHITKIQTVEEQLTEKTIEYNVLNANYSVLQEKLKATTPKPLFPKSTNEETEIEINKLKTQLDEANKAMIKLKLKTKQLQKQVDSFKKISDVNSELIKITAENQQFQQKIAELEEEKGQLQLKLVSGEPVDAKDSELERKLQILETTCQNQTSAIQLLEEQKLDMTESLQMTKQELESLKDQMNEIDREETARVVCQIESIQLEEKVNTYLAEIQELKNEIDQYKAEVFNLNEIIQKLQQEKEDLSKKADHYIAENMELLDKIEKLSKSSSSAESIEIVERLTQQEKLEIEAFNKRMGEEHAENLAQTPTSQTHDEADTSGMGQELSESLTKLKEESSELMQKIELFTTERKEVLDKMETLTNENQEHIRRINELNQEKLDIGARLDAAHSEQTHLQHQYDTLLEEKNNLLEQIDIIKNERNNIIEELNILKKEKASLVEPPEEVAFEPDLVENCKESLDRLSAEIENFYKANDKNSKINSSKKLAKEAKNTHQRMVDLIEKVKLSPKGGADTGQLEELLEKVKTLKCASDSKDTELDALKKELDLMRDTSEKLKESLKEKEITYDTQISELQKIRKEVESKLETTEKEVNILKALVAEQKQQLIDAYKEQEKDKDLRLEEIQRYELEVEKLRQELENVQNDKNKSHEKYVAELQKHITELESALIESKALVAKYSVEVNDKQETINALNAQIMDLYKSLEENSSKINDKDEEIAYLQELLDSNRAEMDRVNKENVENKAVVEKLLLELHSHAEKIAQLDFLASIQEQNRKLETRVEELEKMRADAEVRNKEQLDKLKKFAANLKKKVAQCTELESKIKELEKKLLEGESVVEKSHLINIEEVSNMKASFEEKVQNLQAELNGIRAERTALNKELLNKELEVEQAKAESQAYMTQIEETMHKLGELQALVDVLHSDYKEKQKKENFLQEQLELCKKEIEEKDEKLKTVLDELHNKNIKFEKCKAIVKEKNREIHRLASEKELLTQRIIEYEAREQNGIVSASEFSDIQNESERIKREYTDLLEKYNKEKLTFQETISRLETVHDGIQAKLQEDMGYIETLEAENNNFKEKICKLEGFVGNFEERRASLERRANLLDAQLQRRADEYEKNEDALIYRLKMLSEHDDIIGRRLLETQEEKEELSDKLDRLKQDHTELMQKFLKLEKEYETFRREKYQDIEEENQSLREQLQSIQNESNKIQMTYESKLASKHAEIDELENELSIQLQNINAEKRSLQESLEKSRDEVQLLKDENVKLKESVNSLEQIKCDLEREITWIRMQNENLSQDQFELQELRMQAIQDKTEIENQKHQLETLVQNHEIELKVLRTQIAELDSMRMQVGQNQTDDQVFIETENKRLKELLAEKEALIENYQKQNLKLQMSALSSPASDPFADISASSSRTTNNAELNPSAERYNELEAEISDLKIKMCEKDEQINQVTVELNAAQQELQHIKFEKQLETEALKSEIERLRNSKHETTSAFTPEQNAASVFGEIMNIREMDPLETGAHDQKKIEDLQRNVSDLEKYAAELENKLKHLAAVHEETVRQLQQKTLALEALEIKTSDRLKELEEKERELTARKSIDSRIWEDSKETAMPSLNMLFNERPQDAAHFDQFRGPPVEEDIITPKKAYLCQPGLASRTDINEGWGWGSEEVALEEKHFESNAAKTSSLISPEQNSEIKLQECEDRIKELELERDRLEEEKVELQVKSGKMMKKLKEYKNMVAQLTASQKSFRKSLSIESSDLDQTIQEELKSQVQQLEEKIAEMKRAHEKEMAEKESLLKRLDVLTAANERMTELKERQDNEVEMYQSQIRQLRQQLKSLEEWGEQPGHTTQIKSAESQQSPEEDDNSFKEKYNQLLRELEDLKVDRDELQALLDEEKENSKISEDRIKNLQDRLISLEECSTGDESEFTKLTEKLKSLEEENQILKNQINETKLMNQNLQLQLSDYQSTVEQLSSESKAIKLQVEVLQSEHQKKVTENEKLAAELQSWINKNSDLSKEIEAMTLKAKHHDEEYENRIKNQHTIQELNEVIQYKDSEIVHLKQEIEDLIKEDQTQSLVQELLGKNSELNQLRQKVQTLEAEKVELENNLSKQLTKDMSGRKSSQEEIDKLQEIIKDLEQNVDQLKSEKVDMENELQELNNHIIASLQLEDKMKQTVLELDMKNIEISELKNSLELLKAQKLAQPLQGDAMNETAIRDLNAQWEAVVEQRSGEIAESWRQHLAEKEKEFKKLEDSLRHELEELKKTQSSNRTANENEEERMDMEMLQKMQAALESQELEIVTLKEQLAMRSAEYARLAAQHDPYAQTTSSLPFDITIRKSSGSDQSSMANKSELDLALYMLHQRDMKCEELTLELMNLLEERDTLQLKLSNSLRQMEEIKRKTGYSESGSESDNGSNTNSPEKPKLYNTTSNEEDTSKTDDNLRAKISQLHGVSHSRDKRLWEDGSQHQRQLENIQEDVANIPPEAVSELVGTDLSNTTQSPSTVLLNWFWGKTNNAQQS